MTNINRAPKIINSNNPIKTKAKNWVQQQQQQQQQQPRQPLEINGAHRKNNLNTSTTYSSSDSTSCCSSLLSSCSPTTPTNNRQITNQPLLKNQKLKQKQNHLVYENAIHQNSILCHPQINRSPSAPISQINHSTLIPHTRNPQVKNLYPSTEDQFDSARINRKILDLEISNASLLAINGALERTKVNQQNEIRTIKKKLQQYGPVTNNSPSLSSSHRGTKLSPILTNKGEGGLRKGLEGQDQDADYEEGEEEADGEHGLSLEKLMEQDLEFSQVVQSIDHLISSATKAIDSNPFLNVSPPATNANLSTTSQEMDMTNYHDQSQQHTIPVGKSKVLNPIQAQRFLSNLDSNNRLVDLQDPHFMIDDCYDASSDSLS